jgi:tetratricopeptide (TPR) repeat protein
LCNSRAASVYDAAQMSTVTIQQAFDSALGHHREGRLREAEALYRQILASHPNQPETLYFLGLIARQVHRAADAASLWRRAVAARTDRVEWQYQLAFALLDANEPYEAASVARKAIQAQPTFAEAHSVLGRALAVLRKFDDALASAGRAVELQPSSGDAHNHLGTVLLAAGRLEEAQAEFIRAIALNPKVADYHRNLAAVRDPLDDVEGSIAAAEEAVRLGGEEAQLLCNLSSLHRRRRDYRAALDHAERALALQPNHASAHGGRAIALLSLGDYEQGFIEYEWRWRCENFTTKSREFTRPMWDGSDPSGRRIFVHTEQGFGDTLQFIRYISMRAARGAEVYVETHPSLRTLIRRVEGVAKVVPSGMRPPDFDLHTPLLSMPKWFKTSLENVPSRVPYITPDPARLEPWKERISGEAVKVGLVWRGNALPDPHRTCPLAELAPLWQAKGMVFYSLQVGDVARETTAVADQQPMVDLSPHLIDFHETAAAMQCLDLVITIDTAAAHLAGAMGRPVWTLLPWAPDWRWMLDREDSPWYPTMRLFRQSGKGQWPGTIQATVEALADFRPTRE